MLTYYVTGIYNSVFHKMITFIQLILKQSMNSDCKPPLLSIMEQILECMLRLERGVGIVLVFCFPPFLDYHFIYSLASQDSLYLNYHFMSLNHFLIQYSIIFFISFKEFTLHS